MATLVANVTSLTLTATYGGRTAYLPGNTMAKNISLAGLEAFRAQHGDNVVHVKEVNPDGTLAYWSGATDPQNQGDGTLAYWSGSAVNVGTDGKGVGVNIS